MKSYEVESRDREVGRLNGKVKTKLAVLFLWVCFI